METDPRELVRESLSKLSRKEKRTSVIEAFRRALARS